MDMGLEGLEAAEDMGAAEEGRHWMAPEGEGQGRSCTAGGGWDKEQWPYMHLEPTDRWGAGTQRAAGGKNRGQWYSKTAMAPQQVAANTPSTPPSCWS